MLVNAHAVLRCSYTPEAAPRRVERNDADGSIGNEMGSMHVKIVVRLNQPLYDRQVFLDRGIDHMELYFDDGTNRRCMIISAEPVKLIL